MNPRVVMALFVVAVAALVALVLAAGGPDSDDQTGPARFEGAVLPAGLRAPEIGLDDQDGERVRMADLRGEPVVVTFLYSHCEDTCPAQAQQVKGALNELGSDVPVLAISVDPASDTPLSAGRFLNEQRMTGRMRFVLGPRAELKRIWDGYGVLPQVDDLDHTARIVLVDAKGVQRVGYPLDKVTPEGIAHDLQLLVAER